MFIIFVILAILIAFAAIYFLVFVRVGPQKNVDSRLLCDYAHRGLHNENCPENSLSAFVHAVKQGFGIELDVQLSKDGEIFVFHDYLLKRMTGVAKRLSELTAAELDKIKLIGTNEKIPRLRDVLHVVDGKVPLLIELKGESLDTSLCKPLAKLLERYKGAYCLESFNPCLIGKMKKLLPDCFCGLLYTNLCREKKSLSPISMILSSMSANIIARPDFIAYKHDYRKSLAVKITTKLYNAKKFSWTLKTKAEYAAAKQNGEFAIFEGFLPKEKVN